MQKNFKMRFILALIMASIGTCVLAEAETNAEKAKLKKGVEFQIFKDGKVIGNTQLPAGSQVDVSIKLTSQAKIGRGPMISAWVPLEDLELILKENPRTKGGTSTEMAISNYAANASQNETTNSAAMSAPNSLFSAPTGIDNKETNSGDYNSTEASAISYEDVNTCINLPLLNSEDIWEESADEIASRLKWEKEDDSDNHTTYTKGTTKQKLLSAGARVTKYSLSSTKGKPFEITITFANKGDYAETTLAEKWKEAEAAGLTSWLEKNKFQIEGYEAAIKEQTKILKENLEKLFETKGKDRQLHKDLGYPEDGLAWVWKNMVFFLASKEGEYVKLRILKHEAFDGKTIKNLAKDRAKSREKSIVTLPNGSVILTNIPHISQGPRGYCMPATLERILIYYGLNHIDADRIAVNTTAPGGGGPPQLAFQELGELLRKIGLRPVIETAPPNDGFRYVKEQIDKGNPIIFYNKDPHCNLIVGYNPKTKEIATSDSDENERKRYLEQDKTGNSEIPGHQWISAKRFEERFVETLTLD
jgi:hypothetical protein